MNAENPYTRFGLVPAEIAASVPGLDFLRSLLDETHPAPPVSETASLWLTQVERGRIAFEGRPSARFYNPMGTVHGGWIGMLLDSAMGCAVHSGLEAGHTYTTVEMKVVFVRPLFAETGPVRCEAWTVHQGRRIATSEGRIFDGAGTLLAHGSETCLITKLDTPRS